MITAYASYNIGMLGLQNYSNYQNSKNPFNNNNVKMISSMSRKDASGHIPYGK